MTRRQHTTARYLRSVYTWHRWLGVIASLFVLLLATTGLVLNHSDDLKLNQRYICGAFLLKPYQVMLEAPALGLEGSGHWWTLHADWLWYDTQPLMRAPTGSLLVRSGDDIALQSPDGDWHLFAPNGALIERGTRNVDPSTIADHQPLPESLVATLQTKAPCQQVSWERWLLDLHAGRLFGAHGSKLMDAAAILFIVLACSGLVLWQRFRRSRKPR